MKKFAFAALAAATVLTTPTVASAQTYDAFTSFTGTAPQSATANGGFIYGQYNPALAEPNAGSNFTANTNCFIDGATCLQLAANHDVPGVAKGGAPAFQYGSVFVPNDRLLIHPANTDELTYAAFVAPTAGVYRIYATFNVQDNNPSGVDIFRVGTTSGGLPITYSQIGSIGAGNSIFSTSQLVTLGQSEAIGYAVGRQGFYGNDSTGLQFTVLAGVPEPTSWALMILGFGVVGYAMRRKVRTTVSYA